MIRNRLLIAAAITASVVATACSDMTAPNKLEPAGTAVAAIVAPNTGAVTVVARINGGGTAEMGPPGRTRGISSFGMGVTLLSDGTATGHFDCVDHQGDPTGAGNIFGEATSWSMEGDVIVVNVTGKFIPIPGGDPRPVSFKVKIQQFGGAGVGHWSLVNAKGVIVCWELLISGQIVYKPE
jgi:hypothetical protein